MMNVTRSGSCRRFRTSFAARPRSPSPESRRPEWIPRRSCHRGAGRLDEAELRHRLEQPGVARELEERVEAGALARAEAVAELLEVARKEAGRVAVPLGRLERELLGLGAREP